MTEAKQYTKLDERTLAFSVALIKHCAKYKQSSVQPVISQVIRSATSVGANYAEANNAASKTDFRAKIFIAKKEAAETKYWLEILARLGDDTDEIKYLQEEVQGILMTLQKIISTLKKSTENGKR